VRTAEQIALFKQSVAKYPNIKTGEEFKGYRQNTLRSKRAIYALPT